MIAKRRLFAIHKWCGLVAALFILIQAVTGTMLVYRAELAQIIDPQGMVRHTERGELPLSAVMGSIRRAHPDYEIQRLVFPPNATSPYFAHLVDGGGTVRYVSVDPGDGRILRFGSIWAFPVEAALFIHFRLMTGRAGLVLVLMTGLAILTLALSGLLYWWPKRGRMAKSLTIDLRHPGRIVLRQFHRSTGVLISALLLLSSTTGIFVGTVFLLVSGPLYAVTPSGAAPHVPAGIDRMLALARAQFPGHAIRDIRMPARGAFNVYFLAPERNPSAVHAVRIDLDRQAIVATLPAQQDGSLWVPILPIHDGALFGPAGRIVILAAGLTLAGMAITGPLMYIQRRRAAKPRSRGRTLHGAAL